MNGNEGFKSLIYAVRLPVLARLGGRLAWVLALLCVPPMGVAIWFGEFDYLISFATIMIMLCVFAWLTRTLPDPKHLMRSEGFVLTCSAFIFTPVILSFALWPSGLSCEDRLFESVSAATTTGLSILTHVASADKTLLFTRAWMQWFGGLGIVILSVTFLMQKPQAAYQLLAPSEDQGLVSSTIAYAKRSLIVYVWLSLFAVLVCWVAIGDSFQGMIHGLSAISTGGFSGFNDSLTSLSFGAQMAVMSVGVAGAISLMVYVHAWRRSWKHIAANQELTGFIWILLATCSALTLFAWLAGNTGGESLKAGLIMGLSAISSTGFTMMDTNAMSAPFKLMLVMAMFLGGCTGSTAGGFKIFRLLVLLQLLLATLRRASAAQHAVIEPRVQGRVISEEQIQMVMLTGSLLVMLCLLSWLPFVIYGYDPLDALFEVVSAVGTVGLSSGITQTALETPLKWILCIDMVAGRVEVLAFVCLFYPGLWVGHRNTTP
ncbi:MAG: TrkH family potassium uptake protein [Hahellaceae bacterium]|nr:TrkH family potassium uptake protein [Hahellaceae bacterium]